METTNYKAFKFLDGNRELNPALVKKLKASIKKNGWIGGDIIVNENREIIDGQHRFQACKELKEPIRFTVKKRLWRARDASHE